MKRMHATLALAIIALPATANAGESPFAFGPALTDDPAARSRPSLLEWDMSQDEAGGAEPLAEGPGTKFEGVTFYWENDGGLLKPYDDNDGQYTDGLGLTFAWTSDRHDTWRPFIPFIGSMEDPGFAFGGSLRHFMYTPSNISTPDLVTDDRPYAGWLTAGFFAQRSDEHRFEHVQLDLGVVGGEWSAAEHVQKFVHSALPTQVRPQGWDNQLANEFAINAFYQTRWRTERARWGDLELDAIPLVGGELGNVSINAHAGVIGRIGFNLPDDFGPANLREFRDHTGRWHEAWCFYGYGRLDGEAVAHDIFLDGNTFADSHSVNKNPLVASVTAGLVVQHSWFRFGYAITYETDRFEGQNAGHSWGSLELTAAWSF